TSRPPISSSSVRRAEAAASALRLSVAPCAISAPFAGPTSSIPPLSHPCRELAANQLAHLFGETWANFLVIERECRVRDEEAKLGTAIEAAPGELKGIKAL